MPTEKPLTVYWDTCIFLAYLNSEEGRVNVIEDLWDKIASSDGKSKIVTASTAIVEVAQASVEKNNQILEPKIARILGEMWREPSLLIVELPLQVMFTARNLIRDGLPHGWKLKTLDALHLAAAKWVNEEIRKIDEFHTYDKKLDKYATMIGIPICRPSVDQPSLITRSEEEKGLKA